MDVYTSTKGFARTEQDLVMALDDFLVDRLGWTKVETISDSTSNRDYAWSSPGEPDWVAQGGDPIYIRVRGQSDYWYCYGFRTYTNSSTYTFRLYDGTNTRVDLSSDAFDYWMYGNRNFVCCIIKDYNHGEPLVAYLGLIRPYHDFAADDFPMMIKTSYYNYRSWTYYDAAYMHDTLTSGQGWHEVFDWWNTIQYDKGLRNAKKVVMLPLMIWDDNGFLSDQRGEPYGVYQINGTRMPIWGCLASASGVFITAKIDNNNQFCNAYGPVASGIDEYDMWQNDYIYYNGVKT